MRALTRSSRFAASLTVACAAFALTTAVQADAASLTLEASKKQLQPKQTTDLSGTLSDTFSSPDGKTITLYASQYPYESESVVTTTSTTAGGSYSFSNLDPVINTRYRTSFDGDVLDGDASSATVQIFRFIKSDFDLKVTRTGAAKARFDLLYPDEVQPEYYVGREDANWYFRKTNQNTYKRVAKTSFFDTDRGVGADVKYKLPRSRKAYRFFFQICVDAPAQDIGIGNDKPSDCPSRFRAGGNRAATPRIAPDPPSALR